VRRERRLLPYLVLLRAGFTVPRTVTSRAVRSYRTFSPLPDLRPAVCFLWHFPWARALQALPGALSEGARTFLCNGNAAAIASPTPTFLDRGFYRIASRLRIIATLVELQESRIKIVRFAAADPGGYFRRFLGRQVCREFK